MAEYLLAHDIGTSGNKATLYTIDGKLVASEVYPYDAYYLNNNWAEQDAEDWWKAVCYSTKKLTANINVKNIAAVSFSGQMMGCLCVNRKGIPLRRAIIWADQRADKEAESLEKGIKQKDFYKITGHRISPAYSLEKLMWIKNNEPEIYRNTYKMLNSKDYIIFKLTGEFITDRSDASGTNLYDLINNKWSDSIIDVSGIDENMLPKVHESIYAVGGVTKEAAQQTGLAEGTLVVCGGGDGSCAAVGAGCIENGMVSSVMGSSANVAIVTEKILDFDGMKISNWGHIVPGKLNVTGSMQTAGLSYNWLKNEICRSETMEAVEKGISPYKIMDEEVEKSRPGSMGVIFLPYLLGERSPYWNPKARGAFIGLTMEHKREDILRSVLEGVIYNLNISLDIFKKYYDINELVVMGGGAKGVIWQQIMADIYNIKVRKPKFMEEASSTGAAIAAGIGAGIFKDFNVVDRFIEIDSTYLPNCESRKIYDKGYKIFKHSYEALTGIYDEIANYNWR